MLSTIKFIRLSKLTREIEEAIRDRFGAKLYWISAEIANHKYYAGQERHYFEFIEKAELAAEPVAKIRAVAWRTGAEVIRKFESSTGQKFTNGVQLLVQVKLEFHPAYGISLVLLDIDESFTLGNLERQRRDTLLRLVAENPAAITKTEDGFLTTNQKIKLPGVIQQLAIIGSANSEGYTDFIHTIANNQYGYQFSIDNYHAAVQGSAAGTELVKKMTEIFFSGKKYDCIVIIRGGGAQTDFLVFDSYDLSKAVATFPIPVITGIGHHRDVSIVDLMANTSTKTPTKAAEFIVSHNRGFEDHLLVLEKSIVIQTQQRIGIASKNIQSFQSTIVNKTTALVSRRSNQLQLIRQTLAGDTRTSIFNRSTALVLLINKLTSGPKLLLERNSGELQAGKEGIDQRSKQMIARHATGLSHYLAIVRLMDPVNLLKKGFAIILEGDNIVINAAAIKPGTALTIAMQDYKIKTRVISKSQN